MTAQNGMYPPGSEPKQTDQADEVQSAYMDGFNECRARALDILRKHPHQSAGLIPLFEHLHPCQPAPGEGNGN